MNRENKLIQIHSFNTRGLRNKCKRRNVFQWLNTSHPGITMIQETHSILTFSENMNNICTEFSLTDIWRIQNPTIMKFTRIERSRNGIVQSRLDYLLTSISLTYQIKNTKISPGNSSDHSIISLSLNIGKQREARDIGNSTMTYL